MQTKFSASSILPEPLYCATFGYGQSGRVRSGWPFVTCVAVKGINDALRFEGHLMLRSITEVDKFLRMSQRETATAANVSRIRGTGRVSTTKRFGHCGIADRSCPSAISNSLVLVVPICCGHPYFDLDVRVAGGSASQLLGKMPAIA